MNNSEDMGKNNLMNPFFKIISCFLSVILFFWILGCSGSIQHVIFTNELRTEGWDTTIATVYKAEHAADAVFLRYKYEVNGTEYDDTYFFQTGDFRAQGSKFLLLYNPDNPEEKSLLLHRQLFLDNEPVAYSIGRVNEHPALRYIKPDTNNVLFSLSYAFQAHGEYFKGVSHSVPNPKKYPVDYIAGKLFVIKYWDTFYPGRSMILIDYPVASNYNAEMIFENPENTFRLKRKLRRAAKKVGSEGVIFWAPRKSTLNPNIFTIPKNRFKNEIENMEKFLEKHRDEFNVKEIEIVDNRKIDSLLKKYSDW